MKNDNEIQEILANLELRVKKLLVLLKSSRMPEDVKDSWIAILPEMSLKQVDRFVDILEAQYLDEQTKEIDEQYLEKLRVAMEKINSEESLSEKNFLEKIENFKKII